MENGGWKMEEEHVARRHWPFCILDLSSSSSCRPPCRCVGSVDVLAPHEDVGGGETGTGKRETGGGKREMTAPGRETERGGGEMNRSRRGMSRPRREMDGAG